MPRRTGATVPRPRLSDHLGRGFDARERNELDAATRSLLTSQELAEHSGFAQNRYRWRVAMARTREARGDLQGALDLLNEAQPAFMIDFSPNVRPIAAVRARILVRLGRPDKVLGWASEQGVSIEAALSYVHEYEHITLARALIASRSVLQASGLLDRLLAAVEEGGRGGSVIELLVLQALAVYAGGDMRTALVPLERALRLAEPERYVRVFVDEGAPMAELLQAAAKRGIARNYVNQLLTAFRPGMAEGTPDPNQALVEPLSERELELLRLLATELDGTESKL